MDPKPSVVQASIFGLFSMLLAQPLPFLSVVMESECKKLTMPTAALRLSVDEARVFTRRLRKFAMLTKIGSKSATVPAPMLDANDHTHGRIAAGDGLPNFNADGRGKTQGKVEARRKGGPFENLVFNQIVWALLKGRERVCEE